MNNATKLDFEIPIIDIEGLINLDSAASEQVGKKLGEACREVGFFYVLNHGIENKLINKTFNVSQKFFNLPLEKKLEYSMENNSKCFRGYSPVLSELADGKRNAYELLEFSVDYPVEHPDVLSKKPMHGPNIWPNINEFQEVVTQYIGSMNTLGFHLMRGVAISLGLSENFFYKAFNGHSFWQFRTVNYPDIDTVASMSVQLPSLEKRMKGIDIGDHNCGAHTDYGCLTILLADKPGLQVLTRDNVWFDAPVIPNAFICNIGDMLQYWTKDLYKATKHRVLTGGARISLPFFFQPDYESIINPIETIKGEVGKDYSPVKYGPYAYKNYQSIYPACSTY